MFTKHSLPLFVIQLLFRVCTCFVSQANNECMYDVWFKRNCR